MAGSASAAMGNKGFHRGAQKLTSNMPIVYSHGIRERPSNRHKILTNVPHRLKTMSAIRNQQTSRLLQLPAEIRLMILKKVVGDRYVRVFEAYGRTITAIEHGDGIEPIWRTCRDLYRETIPLLYATNSFLIWDRKRWINKLPRECFAFIKNWYCPLRSSVTRMMQRSNRPRIEGIDPEQTLTVIYGGAAFWHNQFRFHDIIQRGLEILESELREMFPQLAIQHEELPYDDRQRETRIRRRVAQYGLERSQLLAEIADARSSHSMG